MTVIWGVLSAAILVPIAAATVSPQLAWRDPIYIAAGFAGIIALVLLLAQPVLVGGYLPGLPIVRSRRIHRWIGIILVVAVTTHVAGLWITSPPDVIDALLFTSPTPFSAWGVIAMWAAFAAAILAGFRQRFRLRLRTWRIGHTVLALITVLGSVVHAVLIEGAMETLSKIALCVLVLAATLKVVVDLRVWAIKPRREEKL